MTWWQVIILCSAMIGSVYGTLVRADNETKKEIKVQNHKIECKVDNTSFNAYKVNHRREAEKLINKFEVEFRAVKNEVKEVKQQVTDSEKKIIRLLTIQEMRRNNGGN